MNNRVFELRMQYQEWFGVDIPNEPSWPEATMKDPSCFERLLERSISDGVDHLTEAYGEGWNELDPAKIY